MKVLDLFSWQRSLYLLLVLCHEVAANTEIITFSPSREQPVLHLAGNWSTLRPSANERRWTLEVCQEDPSSCPHALWVLLDLDDEKWAPYPFFSLRLSWPASAPADVSIALARLSGSTRARARVARVAVTSGVAAVPILIVLEPAYFGVLPASLVPTFAFLVPVLLVAAWLARWVSVLLEPYARQARADLNTGMTRTLKEA